MTTPGMPSLDELLRVLHRRGWLIDAWRPLSSGDFECYISEGASTSWATSAEALDALHAAMVDAGLMPRIVVLGDDQPWPPSVRST